MTVRNDLKQIFSTLPRNSVSPENRNVAQLVTNELIKRGFLYRMLRPDLFGDDRPRIVIHPVDRTILRAELMTTLWGRDQPITTVDQHIADACEECFARKELHNAR